MPIDAWLFAGHPLEPMNETSHFAEASPPSRPLLPPLLATRATRGIRSTPKPPVRRRPHEDGRRYAVQA